MNIRLYLRALSLLMLASVLSILEVTSQNVSYKPVKIFAEQFFAKQNLNKKAEDAELVKIYSNENNDTLLYIFNSSKGYVVLSGDSSVYPVLGYSYEGKFITDNINPSLDWWLNNYAQQIKAVKEYNSKLKTQKSKPQTHQINVGWNNYLKSDLLKTGKTDTLGANPLVTANWSQGPPYNYYCPVFSGSIYGGRCVTGCVATAMGEILQHYGKLYNWPPHGYGSNTYLHPYYGNITVDFSKQIYNWADMPNSVSTSSDTTYSHAVARLLYDCGVAIDMGYTPTESGSDPGIAATAFVKYFNYRNTISLESRSDLKYTTQQSWNSMLADNLEEGHPIMYSGSDASYGGHEWVCDGYYVHDTTYYFHMNWGWSGGGNAYYFLYDLSPKGQPAPDGKLYKFSASQQALVNIVPPYPIAPYCIGKRLLTDSTREISSGNGESYYGNNTHCDWLIEPIYAKEIVLKFNGFSTEAVNDVVTVYDGDTIAPIHGSKWLASFSGTYTDSALATMPVVAKSGKMYITFNTNSTVQGEGWDATYHTVHIVNPPNLKHPLNDTINTPAEVTLKWGPVVNTVYNYKLQLDTTKAKFTPTYNTHFIKILKDSSYTAKNLRFGKTYYWRVKSFERNNNFGWSGIDSSGWSGINSFTVINTVTLKNPANKLNTVTLPAIINWAAIKGSSSYTYQIDITPNFNSPSLIKKTNSYSTDSLKSLIADTLTNLTSGTTYYWRVRASDATSQTLWSSTYSFTTLRTINQPVQLVSPADSSINQPIQLTLRWNPLQAASSYLVQLYDSSTPATIHSYKTNQCIYNLLPTNNILLFGHTYYWRVQGSTASNISPWSDYYLFTIANSLQTISPANGVANQPINPTLKWSSITGVTDYQLQIDTTPNFTSKKLQNDSALTSSSKALSGLSDSITYYWRVRAINGKNISAWSDTSSFTTIPKNYLAVPVLTSPKNNAVNQSITPTLKWSGISGATSYQLTINTLQFTTSNSSFLIPNSQRLSYNTEYLWKVKAKSKTASSQWSVPFSFLTIDTMPNAPQLFLPVNGATNQMPNALLLWDKISGATGYVIQTDTSGSFTNPVTIDTNTYQTTLSNLRLGVKYYWRVKAFNSNHTTNWSDTFSFTVINTPVTIAPANGAINLPITSITVSWKHISGISGYQCELDTTNKFSLKDSTTTLKISPLLKDDDTTYTYNNLLFATTYFWRVRAIDVKGGDTIVESSAWSSTQCFTTQKAPVILYPPNNEVNGMPNYLPLVFTSLAGATEYDYRIDTTKNFNTSYLIQDSTYGDTAYNIYNLMLNTKYYIKVRGRNSYDTSNWSQAVIYNTIGSFTLTSPTNSAINQSPLPQLEWDNTEAYQYNYMIDVNSEFNSNNREEGSSFNNILPLPISNILKFGTKYYWQVQAQAQNSFNTKYITSNIGCFNTIDTVVTVSPTDNFSLGNSNQVTFIWESISGVVYYELQYATTPLFISPVVNQEAGSLTTATITGFAPNTNYWWRIRAISSYPDTTKWSKPLSIDNVKNITQDNTLKIYPNPANDFINLEISLNINSPVKVNILSLTGQTIHSESLSMNKNVKYRIDISELNSGLYILEVDYGKAKVYKKLIKE